MKITESQLKQIISEEIQLMVESGEIDEGILDRLKARAAGAGDKLKSGASRLGAKAASALGADQAASDMSTAANIRATDAKTKQAMSIAKSYVPKAEKLAKVVQVFKSKLEKDLKKLNLDQQGLQNAMEVLDDAIATLQTLTKLPDIVAKTGVGFTREK
jgi:hypothetical protein